MRKKITTEQFIEKAILVHGDKYNYSITEYYGVKNKIKIICSQHGIFEQIADSHLQGRGCRECSKNIVSLKLTKISNENGLFVCTKCLVGQPKDNFHKNGSSIVSVCKTCSSIIRKDFYETNKEETKNQNKLWKINNRARSLKVNRAYLSNRLKSFRIWLDDIKNVSCLDCGQKYPPCAMDFDHRDPKQKSFNISAAEGKIRELVLEEIKKCDIVCANCHRIRGHNRNHTKISYWNKIIYPFKDKPCMDCNIKFPPYVMDFDHRDPNEKLFHISKPSSQSRETLIMEIMKCDVVCANCHRVRTFTKVRAI